MWLLCITKHNDNTDYCLCKYPKNNNNLVNVSTILLGAESPLHSENLFLYLVIRLQYTILIIFVFFQTNVKSRFSVLYAVKLC